MQWIRRQIMAIPTEEITRQYRLLDDGGATRNILTFMVYVIGALMVPLPLVVLCCAVDFSAEWYGKRQMRGLDPSRQVWRYISTVLALCTSQLAYALALSFAFHSGLPLSQAFATGVMTLTMLQLASIRVIHLPYAAAGLATTFLVAFVALLVGWQTRAGLGGLIASLLAICLAVYFIYEVVRANHALHAGIARERETARLADLAKSRFLAQMSHELRTPLNAILGLSHAEMAEARDEASAERMRLVTDAARGLAVILDDILDMAAIEAGHLPIRPAACSPACEVNAAVDLYRPLFEAQGLSLALELTPDFPAQAVLDPQRLRQCLTNLLSNALKHTKTGGVRVLARADWPWLDIIVADTGPGIPEAEAERIFQPFQRGTSGQPGTGLGLSITRALARSMGGDLLLLSSGQGARFHLRLRIATATGGASPPHSVTLAQPLPEGQGAVRVLVVDDIATNRLVAKAHLRIHGLDTEEASSGEEAVEMIRQAPPDLVLLDMNMPDMDGIATLRQIRKLPSRAARVPVVAMTADATEAHRRRYLEAGLDGYLAKPLTPEAVAEIIARFLPQPEA